MALTELTPKQVSAGLGPDFFLLENTGAPEALDPATNNEPFGSALFELLYETLVTYKDDSPHLLEGQLATNWTISPDGLQYNFTLRDDVIFPHGDSPFNAYVIKFSLDRLVIMNDHWGPAWMIQQVVKGGKAIMESNNINLSEAHAFVTGGAFVVLEEFLFQINLERVYSPFLHLLTHHSCSAISPRQIAENAPADYTTDGDDLFGQLSFEEWFPHISGSHLRQFLDLPSDWDLAVSGVVPSSPADSENSHDWIVNHAEGTGPYELSDLDPGTLIELRKNVDWWGNFSADSVNNILILTVNEETTRFSGLLSGHADSVSLSWNSVVSLLNLSSIPFPTIRSEYTDDLQVFFSTSFTSTFLGMNLNTSLSSTFIEKDPNCSYDAIRAASLPAFSWNDTPGPHFISASPDNPFTALAFRKAFAHAFDYNTFFNLTKYGVADRMSGIIPSGMFGHQPTLIDMGFIPTFDPVLAKTLFQQVNWTGTINLPFSSDLRSKTFNMLADVINNLDVGITISSIDSWIYYPDSPPLFFLNWQPYFGDPDCFLSPFFSNSTFSDGSRFRYYNPSINFLLEEAVSTTNRTIRENIYREIEERAALDYPFLYGFQAKRFFFLNTRIFDFETSGSLNPMSLMFNLEYMNKLAISLPTTSSSESTTTSFIDHSTGSSSFTPSETSIVNDNLILLPIIFLVIYSIKSRKRKQEI